MISDPLDQHTDAAGDPAPSNGSENHEGDGIDSARPRLCPRTSIRDEEESPLSVAQDDSKKAAQRRKRPAVADPRAREFLRQADPVLARLIDERPARRAARFTVRP